MDSFSDIDGAFKSLTDTLQNRLSPFFNEAVSEAWLGAIGHASAIARDVNAWNGLPATSPNFDVVVLDLDGSARRLASASGSSDVEIIAALGFAESALSKLDTLLGR